MHHELILILDFGSQYTQLIARRVREQGVYCEIHPFHLSADEIAAKRPEGVILSGGPSSVTDKDAPRVEPGFYDSVGAPILGICYGMQMVAVDLDRAPVARMPQRVTVAWLGVEVELISGRGHPNLDLALMVLVQNGRGFLE